MQVVKTYEKGQIVIPKAIRDALGIRPGKNLAVELVEGHIEITPIPDDPIEYLTGIFRNHPTSLADELADERKSDDRIDEKRPF